MQLFSNNAKTQLTADVNSLSTSISVLDSSIFPVLNPGDYFLITLENSNKTVIEVMKVTSVVGNTLTVVRGQENTTIGSFAVNDIVELRLTSSWLNQTESKLNTIETGAQVNTVTPDNTVTLTNKTIDDISNVVGSNRVSYKVKNMTGSTLSNGTVVKVSGYEAGEETIRVTPTTSTSDVAIGIVKGNIPQGEIGLVVNTGVASGINTTGYTTGSILYQNGSGGLTHTKPTTGTYQAVAVPLNSKTDGALLVEFTEPNLVDWDSRYYTETEVNNLLSGKQNTITGAASSVVTSNLNPNVVVTTDASGKLTHATAISTTELSYLDGVSSNIQTQLGGKQATITGAATTITSSNLTASMALVSDASGKVAAHGTVSATELGYLDGVTSSIQTQLNSKEPTITTLPVSKGGTGVSTLTGLVKGNGTTAFTAAVAGTDYVIPSGSITGNAATATTLQTARTINGVSFNGSANITIADSTKIPTTEKGTANGVATLDANGKVVLTQIPDSVLGQLEYMGTHNFTNMPTATQKGQYWIASVAGNGYEVGDWAVYNGTTFDKVDNTDAVSSVAGRTGNVVLTKSDVGLSLVDNTADASKNVATASTWTTARTITIGSTGKSVNGSANVSWSLAEIGAQAAGNYQPLDADLTAIAGLAGTSGFLKKTAADTWALDTSTYLTGNQSITFSGDATGSGTTSVALTLANTGVTAGTYNNSATAVKPIVVDAKGRITGVGADVTITPAFSSITSKPTTLAGYGITDAATSTHNHTIDSLSNVVITANSDNEVLAWDTTTSKWINQTAAEAGLATSTHTHSDATTSVSGFMSGADKLKLDGIATGAEVNQNTFSNIAVSGQTTVAADSKTDTLTLIAGSNVTITTDAVNDTITISSTDTNTTYTAGNGLTLTGTTFDVVSHAGTAGTIGTLTVTADSVGVSLGTTSTTACAGNDVRLSDARTPLAHTHGDISNTGTISSTAVTPTSTDYILISDTSASGAIKRGILVGSDTTTYLRNDGTWGTPPDTNTFPTTWTWTAGTTSGPTASITGTSSTISVAAVPSASVSAAGIVTTGAQEFAGAKVIRAASTQDGIELAGRSGGTNSYKTTLTPGTLSASNTLTLPTTTGTLALTSQLTGGTVTSVGLSLPNIFSVSGSPVTTAGTLTATLASQTANTVLASPNGSSGAPTFRTLVAADIPPLDASKITSGALPVLRGGTGTTTSTGTGSVVLSDSPAFTGTPTGTTAAVGTNTTQLATTAFVQAEIANDAPTKTGGGASGTWGINITGNAGTASALSAGATAADSGIFHLNNQVVTVSYSIPTGKNAMTAGPISINDGITVTIPDGSTWTVV